MLRDPRADRLYDRLAATRGVTRRNLLRSAAALAAYALLRPARAAEPPPVRFTGYPFTLGVASGYPSAGGVSLWTRLAPEPLQALGGMTLDPVPVTWQVAADERFARVVREGATAAFGELAHSVHVDVDGLEPAREYWYRFIAGGETSPVGRTRTLPAPGGAARRVRFAYGSCAHFEHGWYSGYRHMLADAPDLVLFLGDYIYEGSWGTHSVRRHAGPAEAFTLGDYRVRHAQTKTDADLQRLHAQVPWAFTWDDHEVDNDYAGTQSEHLDPQFLARRTAAYQAYFEHMPLPWRMLPKADGMPIHAHLDFGDLARFYLLDDRQYRTPQACQPQGRGGSGDVDAGCAELTMPERTMLGAAQERWLEARLGDTRAHWNVLAQQTLFGAFENRPGPEEGRWSDAWDGYPASRERVLAGLERHRVANPVVVGGDVHAYVFGDVHRDAADPDSPVVASEFCGSSISSEGRDAAWWHARGAENPQVRYLEPEYRGYVLVTLDRRAASVAVRGLDDVLKRDSGVRTLATFAVESGKPGVQRA
jgi:alkaline phosphatase D